MKSTKPLIIVLIVVSLLPWLWSAINTINPGRFQLYFGKVVKAGVDFPVCFKLDSQTGDVWQYQFVNSSDANGSMSGEGFVLLSEGESLWNISTIQTKNKDGETTGVIHRGKQVYPPISKKQAIFDKVKVESFGEDDNIVSTEELFDSNHPPAGFVIDKPPQKTGGMFGDLVDPNSSPPQQKPDN